MEPWRHVWREGIAPALEARGLEALREALRRGDPRLVQDKTATPDVLDSAPSAACAIGFCGWQGRGLPCVRDVLCYFNVVCREADNRLGCRSACRWFLNWFDETTIDQVQAELLPEVERELEKRKAGQ